MAAFYTFVNRALNICSDPISFNSEIQYLKVIALDRGYNPSIVDKALFKLQNPRLSHPSHSNSNISIIIPTDTLNCWASIVFLANVVCLTLDKQNVNCVSVYMNRNSIFEIKKLTNPLLLKTSGKMTTPLIFILSKLFPNPPLYSN